MRIKLSLLKAQENNNTAIPLHHQKNLSLFLNNLIREMSPQMTCYCFSSLKGTSKVVNGQIRFLSSKISLTISCPESLQLETLVKKIFSVGTIDISGLQLIPKSYKVMAEPEFRTETKYICISPVIPGPVFTGEEPLPVDPETHEFSDILFDTIISKMEKAGYHESQLNEYAEFGITPDADYIRKINNSSKKYARVYRNSDGESFHGYLLPFYVHAHPEVHKFIWERGIGLFTELGYGLLDTVPEAVPASAHITP